MMYESPVIVYINNAVNDYKRTRDAIIEETICRTVMRVGVSVDKEELLRALAYDRNQYHKGHRDGEEAAQPKWISVEEKLPEELEDVLILVKETEFYGVNNEFSKSYLYQYVGQYDGEWYTVYCHGHRYINDTAKQPNADRLEVTHWMPLPPGPNDNKEE